jgi:hypothetical protein
MLDLRELRFMLRRAGAENNSMVPVLCEHEKGLYGKVNSVQVAAELSFPGFSMTDPTAAKVNQIKRQFSMTGSGIFAFRATRSRHSKNDNSLTVDD